MEKALVTSSMSAAAINGRDLHGWTALHRACFKGKIEVIRTLLEKGVDMDAKDEDGYTALHCAAESGHADVIEMLVKKGADAEARTNKGVTALQIAEYLHYVGITRILVHRGATEDNSNMAHILTQASVSFGKKSMGLEEEIIKGGMKKKSSRARALRGSFNHSMSLAVV